MQEQILLTNTTVLVTGAAGFIGSYLAMALLRRGARVVGLDNMNAYYDVSLKEWRLREIERVAAEVGLLAGYDATVAVDAPTDGRAGTMEAGQVVADAEEAPRWVFVRGDIADADCVRAVFAKYRPDIVVNLAAQAGVRWSISHPDDYVQSNLIGFYNILEACRHSYDGGAAGVRHLVYASSSSVYGGNKKVPFSTADVVDHPVSLYAATKKSNELMAHAYAKLYDIPCTGLRFFTVYGPAGRPDMAYFGFTNKLRAGETIRIFNYGHCERDFTYVDDIVEGILRVMQGAPARRTGEDGLPVPPYAVYNIGGGRPVGLLEFVDILQQELIRAGVLPADYDFAAHRELVPMQPGDVPVTYADTTALERDYGYRPGIDLRTGLRRFAEWYRAFYME